jgi:hypothetical protein
MTHIYMQEFKLGDYMQMVFPTIESDGGGILC